MAQRGALEVVKRVDLMVESGGVRGTPGSPLTISAYQAVTVAHDQTDLADDGQLDSNLDPRRSRPGAKTSGLTLTFKLTEDTQGQYGDVFESCAGIKIAASSLVLNGGGSQTASLATISSGVPDPWIKLEYTTGPADYLPVHAFTGTTVTFAVQSNKGARTVSAIKNASQCAGAAYLQSADPDNDTISFAAVADRGDEPDSSSWLLQGLVPSSLKLLLPQGERAVFEMAMKGVDWDGPGYDTSTLLDDMVDWTDEFNGWVVDVLIYDPTTPAAFSRAGFVAVDGLDLAPVWTEQSRGNGRTSTGAVPGSGVNGWRRGVHFGTDLVVTVDTIDQAFWAKRNVGTVIGIAFIIYSGYASQSAGKAVCLDFPHCEVNSLPKEATVGAVVGMQIPVKVRRPLTTERDETHRGKYAISFFNS